MLMKQSDKGWRATVAYANRDRCLLIRIINLPTNAVSFLLYCVIVDSGMAL